MAGLCFVAVGLATAMLSRFVIAALTVELVAATGSCLEQPPRRASTAATVIEARLRVTGCVPHDSSAFLPTVFRLADAERQKSVQFRA